MADNTNGSNGAAPNLKEQIADRRRSSVFYGDETKRKASVAQLTDNTSGE